MFKEECGVCIMHFVLCIMHITFTDYQHCDVLASIEYLTHIGNSHFIISLAESHTEKLADSKNSLLLIGKLRIGVNCDMIVYKMKISHFYVNMGYFVRSRHTDDMDKFWKCLIDFCAIK